LAVNESSVKQEPDWGNPEPKGPLTKPCDEPGGLSHITGESHNPANTDSSPLFPITYYLIGHPLIALGLAMLVILCVVSVLRRQVRTAIALWALVFMTFLYVYLQT